VALSLYSVDDYLTIRYFTGVPYESSICPIFFSFLNMQLSQ